MLFERMVHRTNKIIGLFVDSVDLHVLSAT